MHWIRCCLYDKKGIYRWLIKNREKTDEIKLPNTSGVPISTSTIEKCLELEWQDRREVRSQSWKTIDMSITIIGGTLGAQFVLNSSKKITGIASNNYIPPVAIIGGLLLTIASTLGFWICICHAIREYRIMRIIKELEKYLHGISAECNSPHCMIFHHEPPREVHETLLDIISKGDSTAKSDCEEQLCYWNDNIPETIKYFGKNVIKKAKYLQY